MMRRFGWLAVVLNFGASPVAAQDAFGAVATAAFLLSDRACLHEQYDFLQPRRWAPPLTGLIEGPSPIMSPLFPPGTVFARGWRVGDPVMGGLLFLHFRAEPELGQALGTCSFFFSNFPEADVALGVARDHWSLLGAQVVDEDHGEDWSRVVLSFCARRATSHITLEAVFDEDRRSLMIDYIFPYFQNPDPCE